MNGIAGRYDDIFLHASGFVGTGVEQDAIAASLTNGSRVSGVVEQDSRNACRIRMAGVRVVGSPSPEQVRELESEGRALAALKTADAVDRASSVDDDQRVWGAFACRLDAGKVDVGPELADRFRKSRHTR